MLEYNTQRPEMKLKEYGRNVQMLVKHLRTVEENEKRLLRNALVQSKGNRTQAAKMLGMSRRTLHRKLNQWPDLDVR